MASFSEESFRKKLNDLNNSQQSIQTMSLWLIHHRKHAKSIVQVWLSEMRNKAKPSKKLLFLYLANDVVQNSKKKGQEFTDAFATVLHDAFKHAVRDVDDKTKGSMNRLVNIWAERGVFNKDVINDLKKTGGNNSKPESEPKKEPPNKPDAKSKKSEPKKSKDRKRPKQEVKEAVTASKKKKVEPTNITLLDEIENDLRQQEYKDPPTIDELVKAFVDLESAASFDASVRERIASLPQEVSDTGVLTKIQDRSEADRLATKVDEAVTLLADYNQRLQMEMEERRSAAVKLRAFINYQKELLVTDEEKLESYTGRLAKVLAVRKDLQSHIQSLPDLSLLPNITQGLAPLPSAGDLFANQ